MSSATVSISQEQVSANLAKEASEISQKLQQMKGNKSRKTNKRSLNRKTSNSSSDSGSPTKTIPFVLDESKIKSMDGKELKSFIDDDDLSEKHTLDDLGVETTEKSSEMFDPELSDEDAEIIPADLKKSPEMKPPSFPKKVVGGSGSIDDAFNDEAPELDILDSDDEKTSEQAST